jgi:hypothetical protein
MGTIMTVAQLIAALQLLPPDNVVFLAGGSNDDSDNGPCTDIVTGDNGMDDGVILLLRELD